MPSLPVRRADFLMALAYATDLATGHSRDFAPCAHADLSRHRRHRSDSVSHPQSWRLVLR